VQRRTKRQSLRSRLPRPLAIPLSCKNELVSDVEDEVLVPKKGKKACARCTGCSLAAATKRNGLCTKEKSLDAPAAVVGTEATFYTSYHDISSSEGMPLDVPFSCASWDALLWKEQKAEA